MSGTGKTEVEIEAKRVAALPVEELAPVETPAEEEEEEPEDETPAETEAEATARLAAEAAAAAKPKISWKDRQLEKKNTQIAELQRQLAEGAVKPDPNAPLTEAEVERRASLLADSRANVALFNDQCNQMAQAGKLAFSDWDTRMSAIKETVDPSNPIEVTAYNQMLAVAYKTGAGAEVLAKLGQDQDEAARIMALPLVEQTMELTKLASKTPKQVSGAPKPIVPIGRRGAQNEKITASDTGRSDKLDTATWMARRNEEVKAQGARAGRARQ
jgi:hypothetical protein